MADGNICFCCNTFLRDKRPGGNGLTGHHDVVRRVQTDHGALPGTFHKIRHSSLYIYWRSFSMCASMRFISSSVMGSVGWQTRLSTKPSVLMAYLVEEVWLFAMG